MGVVLFQWFSPFFGLVLYMGGAVLPSGRLDGLITQTGPNKNRADGQTCARILAVLVQKGPKRD
jgi:hypothetical protein